MIHPLKAATSYDCDGCGHHASFHRMESKEEEEIARRWKAEEDAKAREGDVRVQEVIGFDVAPKRRRIAAVSSEDVLELVDGEVEERPVAANGRKRKGRG